MAISDISNEQEGNEFDPIEFLTSLLKTIDANRSTIPPDYDRVITSPAQTGTTPQSENRLNVFYRLLGLPATRAKSNLTADELGANSAQLTQQQAKQLSFQKISQDSTLNLFLASDSGSASFFANAAAELKSRTEKLSRKQTADDYETMLTSPLPIGASTSDTLAKGRRASIIPAVVDAAIPVFPLRSRVAPLFFDGDYTISGGRERLSRPFLQHIIYMRTKVFSGASTELVAQIQSGIREATDDDALTALPTKFTKIEALIVNKFIQAIKKSAIRYKEVQQELARLQSEVAFTAAPVDNANQRSITPLSDDPTIGVTTVLGTKIQAIQKQISEQDALLISLPIESVNQSDRIRRIEDDVVLHNVHPDVFVSDFTQLINFERLQLEKQLEEIQDEERSKIQLLEGVKREVLLYSGEFSGLSIFDVLCVLYALFTIEAKFLIGLLNNDAQTRLAADPFFSSGQAKQASLAEKATVVESMDALHNKIKDAFAIASGFFSRAASGQI